MPNKRAEAESSVVSTIRSFCDECGYSPSFRELSKLTDLPVGTVHAIVVDLASRGVLHYHPMIARSVTVK